MTQEQIGWAVLATLTRLVSLWPWLLAGVAVAGGIVLARRKR